jgi:hypothetical protein
MKEEEPHLEDNCPPDRMVDLLNHTNSDVITFRLWDIQTVDRRMEFNGFEHRFFIFWMLRWCGC